jgi:hypothetical protein
MFAGSRSSRRRGLSKAKTVQAVQFEPPKQPLTPDQLSSIVGFTKNAPLGGEELRIAIKKLYKTGRYSNVEVDAEPAGAGVTLIFRNGGAMVHRACGGGWGKQSLRRIAANLRMPPGWNWVSPTRLTR